MYDKPTYKYKINIAGVDFGCALAMILSYNTNKSILWAIVHGIFSWFYVIYFAIKD